MAGGTHRERGTNDASRADQRRARRREGTVRWRRRRGWPALWVAVAAGAWAGVEETGNHVRAVAMGKAALITLPDGARVALGVEGGSGHVSSAGRWGGKARTGQLMEKTCVLRLTSWKMLRSVCELIVSYCMVFEWSKSWPH